MTLTQSEQEIDQLLTLLTELPGETYRSFSHHTSDYTQGLIRLKGKIQSIRNNMVCAGLGCASPAWALPCPDGRFLSQTVSTSLVSAVCVEYDRMKDRCQSFLGELMRLNLI